jgi:hypothetical protein
LVATTATFKPLPVSFTTTVAGAVLAADALLVTALGLVTLRGIANPLILERWKVELQKLADETGLRRHGNG